MIAHRPLSARRSLGLIGAVAVLSLGCGDGVRTSETRPCDPVAGGGCPENLWCRVTGDGPRCLPSGGPDVPDASCTATSCPPGESCLLVEGRLGCFRVCRSGDEECPAGSRCHYALGGDETLFACASPCSRAMGCGVDATCAPSPGLPFPVCVGVGPAGLGDPCRSERCARGLGCLSGPDDVSGSRCAALCDPDTGDGCPAGLYCAGPIQGVAGLARCVP